MDGIKLPSPMPCYFDVDRRGVSRAGPGGNPDALIHFKRKLGHDLILVAMERTNYLAIDHDLQWIDVHERRSSAHYCLYRDRRFLSDGNNVTRYFSVDSKFENCSRSDKRVSMTDGVEPPVGIRGGPCICVNS